jgi:hypothetical protein
VRRVLFTVLGLVLTVSGLTVLDSGPANAVQTAQDRIVTDDPANFTPNVLDGQVEAIVQVGNEIILGGTFTQVEAVGSTTVLSRPYLVAFDATTGAISTTFTPNPDGEVDAIVPASDGSIYVGGYFDNVGGSGSPSLARIDAGTGARVTSFKAPKFDGRIKDLRLVGGRLFLAGYFSTVAGNAQAALATVNATTGAYDPFVGVQIAGTHHGGVTTVMKMDVNPAGTRLVAIGNLLTVNGQSYPQIFMLDLSGASATLADWQTNFYTSACSSSFQSYLRDLDISPDGTYFVVSTTGAYGGSTSACDETSRWNFAQTGPALTPIWTDYTGGDTTYAVAITGSVVYTGGHARWQNNALAGDSPGPGAVSRPGIAALDPINGLPLSWDPTRDRGVGVFDLLATSTGLWVGSDTDHIGPNDETHERIAYFPLTGGTVIPPTVAPSLPNNVYLAGVGTTNAITDRPFDATTVGTTVTGPDGGLAWNTVRGTFMLNGQLYTGWSDGTFTRRSFNGSTYGTSTPVNTSDLITTLASWHSDLPNITGMFFDGGRIYYTKTGSTSLFYRYFTAESDVVGALPFTAGTGVAGLDLAHVSGMFLAGGKLYVGSSSDGNLRRVDFTDGRPVAGTVSTVSGPTIDQNTWNATSMFLFQGVNGAGPPPPPIASPTSYVGSAATNVNATTFSVTVPSGVQAGDALLLFFSNNDSTVTIGSPSGTGWASTGTASSSGMLGLGWRKVATAGMGGSTIALTSSAITKGNLTLVAYHGTSATEPVAASASSAENTSRTTHTTPTVTGPGGWVVSYWADKTSTATMMTPDASTTTRSSTTGSGSGRITSATADSAAAQPSGTVGGVTANSDAASAKAVMFTVELAPVS